MCQRFLYYWQQVLFCIRCGLKRIFGKNCPSQCYVVILRAVTPIGRCIMCRSQDPENAVSENTERFVSCSNRLFHLKSTHPLCKLWIKYGTEGGCLNCNVLLELKCTLLQQDISPHMRGRLQSLLLQWISTLPLLKQYPNFTRGQGGIQLEQPKEVVAIIILKLLTISTIMSRESFTRGLTFTGCCFFIYKKVSLRGKQAAAL